MAKLTLKSENQILGGMAKTVLARTGLNDLNPGSILLTLLQAAATESFAQYYQMLQIIRNYNLDTTTGTDLDNRAAEYGLTRTQLLASSGRIDILREASFVAIATGFFTGFRSRIAGDTVIFVNNASTFPSSGPTQTLIIGRETPNEEEVTYTPGGANPLNNINYYQITLNTPLVNDHSLQESVILKQGVDIFISAGTVVRVPATGRSSEITFSTTVDATILAGDASVTDVNIKCSTPGTIGNIGVNAISGTTAFVSPPFSGARAVNNSAFSNGQDKETDTSLRNRIKAHVQGLSQSTTSGITNAINGLVDSVTAKRVVSSNIILPDNVGLPVKVIIDDGTGFEPDFAEQGEEVIVASAKGGEVRLQIQLFPMVKAQVESLSQAPFDMSTNGLTLNVIVGNTFETVTFFANEFTIPTAATGEEVVKAINANSNLLEARTANAGQNIVINAKTDTNENIQVTGGTANSVFNFTTEEVQTFYLYENDKLLSKDGVTAFIDSGNTEPYNFSGIDRPLSITIDGKTVNIETATIHQSDFPSPAAAASASAAAVAAIINAQIAGAVASSVNGKLRITSNTTLSSLSKIKINTSLAQGVLGYSTVEVVGANKDYTLNPDLGVIELAVPLVAHDLLTAGTRNTRGFLTAANAQNYSFAGGETLNIVVDGGSTQPITFATALNQTAQNVADFINLTLVGGSAVTRTKGLSTFLEIRTNTLDPTQGSIEVLSSSTSNTIFGFTVDTVVPSILPHTAFVVSGSSGPYAFVEGNTLVVVMDNNNTGETFVITMNYDGSVSSGTSTTVFASTGLTPTFPVTGSLINFWVVFKDGANTITGPIQKVDNPTSNIFKYTFKDPPPLHFQDFSVGDQASFSGMNQAVNDGNFLITAVTVNGAVHSPVITRTLSTPTGLTPTTGDRYLISPNANTTTQATVLSNTVFNPSGSPSVGDRYIIAPGANNTTQPNVKGRYADSNNVAVQQIHGYRYIINGVGLNDWAGHNNQIAQYNGIGTPGWLFITPASGDVVFSEADALFYQFDSGSGTWIENDWGGKAGRVATWTGSAWAFTVPLDKEVRLVLADGFLYQYSVSTNLWVRNDWGGKGNKIAQWNGSTWVYDSGPATNDTVIVNDEAKTYQYTGAAWVIFAFWVEVSNTAGIVETVTAAGTGLLGQRRQISAYNGGTGSITLSAPVRATPTAAEKFTILPGTRKNVTDFFNNTKVTSISSKAFIELADQGTEIQISSQLNGSDGFVQVTGGKANDVLMFTNTLEHGLRAYSYYTGLIKLVHSTIYGDEEDLTTFPGVGASGVDFKILPPTVNEVSFSVNVTLANGISLSNVENDIKTQIISYTNSLGIAAEVILSNIEAKILTVQGIQDVKITTPSSNIIIASNELARTKASLIAINVVN